MEQLIQVEDCVLHHQLRSAIQMYFTRHFGRFSSYIDDLEQEIYKMLLLTPDGTFSFSKPKDFLNWLPKFLQRRTIDYLRKVRAIPRPRCGACAHYSKRFGCALDRTRKVRPSSNPSTLPNPCHRFTWAQPTDVYPDGYDAPAPEQSIGDESAKELIERALEELAERDAKGRRAVRAIRLHRIEGLTMMEAGALMGVSHMSVKRAVDFGIRELQPILERLTGERVAC